VESREGGGDPNVSGTLSSRSPFDFLLSGVALLRHLSDHFVVGVC
jgi:hypothetical protein